MQPPSRPFAGLHIPTAEGVTLERFLRCTRVVLSERDGGNAKASVSHGAVASDRLMVKVEIKTIPGEGAHVSFQMARRKGHDTPDPETMARILADIVLRASTLVEVSAVEWLQPSIKLAPQEFQNSMRYVSPKRNLNIQTPEMEGHSHEVDEVEEKLARLFRESDDEGRDRASGGTEHSESWASTGGEGSSESSKKSLVKRAFRRIRKS